MQQHVAVFLALEIMSAKVALSYPKPQAPIHKLSQQINLQGVKEREAKRQDYGLLFHELVHVEQYRQLGIPRFAELYVRGFLSGGGYGYKPCTIEPVLFRNESLM
jgi:hypothetical protein